MYMNMYVVINICFYLKTPNLRAKVDVCIISKMPRIKNPLIDDNFSIPNSCFFFFLLYCLFLNIIQYYYISTIKLFLIDIVILKFLQ